MAMHPIAATNSLWQAFSIICHHYANLPQQNGQHTQDTSLFVKCMLDLLAQIDSKAFSDAEKTALHAAKAYWLESRHDLASTLVGLSQNIEKLITYHSPEPDNRMACVLQVLSIDADHNDDFPEFLENIYHAGLPEKTILATLQKNFDFLPALQAL